jgi:cell division protein FtsL
MEKERVIAMNGLMSDASAMTLTLLLFVALMVSAVFVIVMGGRLARSRDGAKPKRQHIEPERRKAA